MLIHDTQPYLSKPTSQHLQLPCPPKQTPSSNQRHVASNTLSDIGAKIVVPSSARSTSFLQHSIPAFNRFDIINRVHTQYVLSSFPHLPLSAAPIIVQTHSIHSVQCWSRRRHLPSYTNGGFFLQPPLFVSQHPPPYTTGVS